MEGFVGHCVAELDAHARCDVFERCCLPIWRCGAVDGSVQDTPVVVLISVWVEGDLLLC